MVWPNQGKAGSSPRKSPWRILKSIFSLPRPRISFCARYSSSSVEPGETRAPRRLPLVPRALLQTLSSSIQCILPVGLDPVATFPDQRAGETVCAVEPLVAESVAVRYPALVHPFIVPGMNPHHLVTANMEIQIGTDRVVGCDSFSAEPAPRLSHCRGRAWR